MKKCIGLMVSLLLLLAGQAFATFEIKDPANEVYEEKPETPIDAAAISKMSCADFLLDGVKRKDFYKAELKWVDEAVNGGKASGAIEPELRTFCIDNPRVTLGRAAESLGAPAASQ